MGRGAGVGYIPAGRIPSPKTPLSRVYVPTCTVGSTVCTSYLYCLIVRKTPGFVTATRGMCVCSACPDSRVSRPVSCVRAVEVTRPEIVYLRGSRVGVCAECAARELCGARAERLINTKEWRRALRVSLRPRWRPPRDARLDLDMTLYMTELRCSISLKRRYTAGCAMSHRF